MKYIFILLLIAPSVASADVYVVTAQDKSVYSLSESDDCVLPQGYSKDVIKNKKIKDLALNDDITLYTYQGKSFNLDDKKVAEKNKKLQDDAVAREKAVSDKASAIAKLKALGLTVDELDALIK